MQKSMTNFALPVLPTCGEGRHCPALGKAGWVISIVGLFVGGIALFFKPLPDSFRRGMLIFFGVQKFSLPLAGRPTSGFGVHSLVRGGDCHRAGGNLCFSSCHHFLAMSVLLAQGSLLAKVRVHPDVENFTLASPPLVANQNRQHKKWLAGLLLTFKAGIVDDTIVLK